MNNNTVTQKILSVLEFTSIYERMPINNHFYLCSYLPPCNVVFTKPTLREGVHFLSVEMYSYAMFPDMYDDLNLSYCLIPKITHSCFLIAHIILTFTF